MSELCKSVADWRGQILNSFIPGVARLTVVADRDGLLRDETLLAAIGEMGFELISLEDPVAFRFAYETRFRSHWDRNATAKAATPELVVRVDHPSLASLPSDILQAGRELRFGLDSLFPGLSYPVVALLDRGELDPLYSALLKHQPNRLGDDATKDFVLLHVFEIAPAFISQPVELLRVLLRRHYRRQIVPRLLDDRFVQVLRQSGAFESWPLEAIVPDREAFFAFLQEHWPLFLDRLARTVMSGSTCIADEPNLDVRALPDPPFDDYDVRVYLDNLFVEGLLRPVPHSSILSTRWVSIGIETDPVADRLRRLEGLLKKGSATIPDPEARHHDWLAFAWRWAGLTVLGAELDATARSAMSPRIVELRADVDRAFLAWMDRRYAGLHNQPPDPPTMVHHIPRFLARRLSDVVASKVALIVVDGLALDQWIVLRDVLANQRQRLHFRENAAFAWVPTITSVSRQAIFAGMPPLYFPSSVLTTDREASLWARFWADQGLAAMEVGYAKGLGDGVLDEVRELSSRPGMRALGLVVDKVDKIMHGMALGTAGMHNQVRQWASEAFMVELLDLLFDCGFIVFMTSDHGNIEAQGCGRPSEGAMADLRGERVRIYPDPTLRSQVKAQFPGAVEWPSVGLPEDCLALCAPDRSAFIREGERIVGHGGISLEEVIVPMVQIERAAA